MRVIAGKARRLILKSTPGLDTRPTIDRIKETLFNIISPYIEGAVFLDLFSGSGSIGIEALSRGASSCVFVDNSAKAVQCIMDNLEHTGLANDAVVIRKNALGAVGELSLKHYLFDIVYMDPPYDERLEEETLNALASSKIINEDSLIIIEADRKNSLGFIENSAFEIVREKEYKTNKHYFVKLKGGAK